MVLAPRGRHALIPFVNAVGHRLLVCQQSISVCVQSLATKSGRRPPTRAESIGSEMSRSGADRSPMDDADSSDVRNGAPKAKGPSTA